MIELFLSTIFIVLWGTAAFAMGSVLVYDK